MINKASRGSVPPKIRRKFGASRDNSNSDFLSVRRCPNRESYRTSCVRSVNKKNDHSTLDKKVLCRNTPKRL